ncbi:hypothetical protein ACLKA6_001215 [Drosophila palustris]
MSWHSNRGSSRSANEVTLKMRLDGGADNAPRSIESLILPLPLTPLTLVAFAYAKDESSAAAAAEGAEMKYLELIIHVLRHLSHCSAISISVCFSAI